VHYLYQSWRAFRDALQQLLGFLQLCQLPLGFTGRNYCEDLPEWGLWGRRHSRNLLLRSVWAAKPPKRIAKSFFEGASPLQAIP